MNERRGEEHYSWRNSRCKDAEALQSVASLGHYVAVRYGSVADGSGIAKKVET